MQDAIFENYGCYCDEIVLDAHHVFDSSVPVYNRTVELTLFKDKDLDNQQKEKIAVAFFADSIASLILVAASLIPWLLVLAPAAWGLARLFRRLRRKRTAPAPPPTVSGQA